MTNILRFRGWATVLIGAVWLGGLTGCVGDMPHRGAWGAVPKPARVQAASIIPDDYLYYPAYGVYFNSTRHYYVYLRSDGWVTRPTPAGVSVATLLASPMVRMNFHDGPEQHHASVIRSYPKNWPGTGIALVADAGY